MYRELKPTQEYVIIKMDVSHIFELEDMSYREDGPEFPLDVDAGEVAGIPRKPTSRERPETPACCT